MTHYGVIIVGGGIGGAALGKVLSENGLKVLIVEREREFRDRVRGEFICPWGGTEAQKLGIFDLLVGSCANEQRYWHVLGAPVRDLQATTPSHLPALTFYHPEMQETLIEHARRAGVEVRRGETVRLVSPGKPAKVVLDADENNNEFTARLVVCADGRSSLGRGWGKFTSKRGKPRLLIAGVVLEGLSLPADTAVLAQNPDLQQLALMVPLGDRRVRCYLVYSPSQIDRLQGETDVPRFVEECVRAGMPSVNYSGIERAGLLASFDGTPTWVEHPYRDGLALLGDAAGATDPLWGQGLSMALRDANVLSENLLASNDWDSAGRTYSAARNGYFGTQLTVENWLSDLMFDVGPEAAQRRARVLPLLAAEPDRYPDHHFSGPDLPCDERARRRLYGEE